MVTRWIISLGIAAALAGGGFLPPEAAFAGAAKKEAKKGKQGARKKAPPALSPTARLSNKLLQELENKRRLLAQRETEIRQEEARLDELRTDIKKRITALQKLEKRIQSMVQQVGTAKNRRLDHLVRAYSAMPADAAAELVNTLNVNLAVEILRNMKVKKAGAILAVVQPRRAAQLSELLARAQPAK